MTGLLENVLLPFGIFLNRMEHLYYRKEMRQIGIEFVGADEIGGHQAVHN